MNEKEIYELVEFAYQNSFDKQLFFINSSPEEFVKENMLNDVCENATYIVKQAFQKLRDSLV